MSKAISQDVSRLKAPSRRRFLTVAGGVGVGASLGAPAVRVMASATDTKERPRIVKPLPQQQAWQDCELGIVYHFDLPVYLPHGWAWKPSYEKPLSPDLYNPKHLDTDQWLEAARAAGAGYAIFTATHMGGFLQWPSDLYPHGVKQAPWRDGKGDVVGDFIASCHRYGIRPGLYVSTRFNAYWQVTNTEVNFGEGDDDEKQARYIQTCEGMVTELCSRYGDLLEIWFDGGVQTPDRGGPDVLPIVDKHQPNINFYHSKQRAHHRWAGNENGTAGYPCWATMPSVESHDHMSPETIQKLLPHGSPDGEVWMPPMCDAPLRDHEWFWRPDDERKIYSLDALVEMYYQSVGRNGNLILGVTPDRDGLVPQADMKRLEELGKAIRQRLGTPVAKTHGSGNTVELPLPPARRIDHVVLMEAIANGERVREYVVEGLVVGGWWKRIAEGTSIGHKRIQTFDPIEAAKVRLRITESIATPQIRNLAVYRGLT